MEITNNQDSFNTKSEHSIKRRIVSGLTLILTLFITICTLGFIKEPFNNLEGKTITQHSLPLGIDLEYGKPNHEFAGLSERVESFINNRSIINPNAGSWSVERVVNGKLRQYKDLGAESVLIHTQQGNQIHACQKSGPAFRNTTISTSLFRLSGQI